MKSMELLATVAGRNKKLEGDFNTYKDIMRYSMQLAMLKQLLSKKLISDKEYTIIKTKLMKDYNISSNLNLSS